MTGYNLANFWGTSVGILLFAIHADWFYDSQHFSLVITDVKKSSNDHVGEVE